MILLASVNRYAIISRSPCKLLAISIANRNHSTSKATTVALDFFARNSFALLKSKLELKNQFMLSCQPSSKNNTDELTNNNAEHNKFSMDNEKLPFKVIMKSSEQKEQANVSTLPLKQQINAYITLTKPNLTILVMLSAICSYALSPYPAASVCKLLSLTIGTTLCSGAANAINMGREPEFDRKMNRTAARPVVRGLITPQQAYNFAAITGTVGFGVLYFGVNPVVAALGLLNIFLYSWIYTSLKRKSIINTWVGAIVGAIPPLMGWAATGAANLWHPGAWCLALYLYAWQFPHFNALSHNIKDQYHKAGYVMTAFENPKLNARVALRYALLIFPICFGMSYFEITDWYFLIDSSILNGWLVHLSYKFWRQQKINYSSPNGPTLEGSQLANAYAKKMFWCSVWNLPGVLILALLHKKGMFDRWFKRNNTKLQ